MKRNLAQVIIGGAAAAHDAVAKQHVEKFTAKEMRDEWLRPEEQAKGRARLGDSYRYR